MNPAGPEDSRAATDVLFFSYLAHVETLYVDAYPPREYGSEVLRRESFLAADGPIAAGAAARLGLSAVLSSNGVGDDPAGRHVLRTLRTWGVRLATPDLRRTVTPASVVVCDSAGGRTFFPHLPGVLDELASVDLSGLGRARAVYVDCYEVLGDSSKRILWECGDKQLVLANLGGSPPPSWLAARDLGNQVSVVQTSVADGDMERARSVARGLREFTGAEVAVVTAGSGGAVLAAGAETRQVAAPPVRLLQSQGAGSVFSAAFLDRLLAVGDPAAAAAFACVTASLWCSLPPSSLPPTRSEVLASQEEILR